jgi:hypothetical protein
MPEAAPLNYGTTPRLNRRTTHLQLAGILTLFAIFVGAIKLACDRFYRYDHDRFRATIESIPGVRVLRVDGFDDGAVWTVVGASFTIGNKPDKIIYLRFARPSDLRTGRSLPVAQIGPHDLCATYPDGSWPNRMDLGKDGPFANFLPTPIRNIEDLVARYDELDRFLGRLPPDGNHTSPDGRNYQYHIR